MPSRSQTVLVLDLDDTLYPEAEYVRSGLTHVAELVDRLVGTSILGDALQFREREAGGDVWQFVCEAAGLPASVKESLLWAYRLHAPDIRLRPEVRRWLDRCRAECHAVAILTDGRSITQRLKLHALGLGNMPVYISEEWGSSKPDQKRFLAIQERWQGKRYVYVGDNPAKDFLSPNLLCWTTVGVLDSGQHVHSQQSGKALSHAAAAEYEPEIWVRSLIELDDLISGGTSGLLTRGPDSASC